MDFTSIISFNPHFNLGRQALCYHFIDEKVRIVVTDRCTLDQKVHMCRVGTMMEASQINPTIFLLHHKAADKPRIQILSVNDKLTFRNKIEKKSILAEML